MFLGDSTNQIHFDGYQVSDQCMALVRDECLLPTIDAPELGYTKESSNEQYVPDVFYKVYWHSLYHHQNTRNYLYKTIALEFTLLLVNVS